ncbi:hypothetical protein Ciccas_001468 [Cichlidogyrus casuarinus]|uniref:Uncharacterized protein n=1 Tax=Cichlidogyrus casuarinus TaxID=1844966 RepID=A0ABD2QK22_9PLAT
MQGVMQLVATASCIISGLVGGALTGLLLNLLVPFRLPEKAAFTDEAMWEVPHEETMLLSDKSCSEVSPKEVDELPV